MIPAPFEYRRASSVDEAIGILAERGEDAKLLAGGHSLLPLMKLRLAQPALLVDIGRIGGLSFVEGDGDEVRIGAGTRHQDLATSGLLGEQVPLLAHVAAQIGDPQVRHRGTIGGSVAHGDPASDLPAALLALRATIVVRGPGEDRRLAADHFFTGFLETALSPDEIITEIRVPAVPGVGWAFEKFKRRAQDWAVVAVTAVLNDGHGGPGGAGGPGVGLINMGSRPLRAHGVEEALRSGSPAAAAAERAHEGTEPPDDLNASADYRRHLVQVLTRRALATAGA